mmetsp:Transcript_23030/g.48274  ORF Transcript_23030/g.48274 Transcript_23030/m.48274 type:complete len:135 (-) Transcript_23030:426-830(-)
MGAFEQPSFDLFALDPGTSQSSQAISPFEDEIFLNRVGKSSEYGPYDDAHKCNSHSTKRVACSIATLTNEKATTKKARSSVSVSNRKPSKMSWTNDPTDLIPVPQDEQNISAILIDLFPWVVCIIWAGLKIFGI